MMRTAETTRTQELRSQSDSYSVRPQSNCARCGGLMVNDVCIDLLNSASELECTAQRCVQCGEIVDSVILRNRSLHRQSSVTQHHPVSMH
jgi:ArsR family metal-binding transcriptional regulator